MKKLALVLALIMTCTLAIAGGNQESGGSGAAEKKDLHVFHFKVDQIDDWEIIAKEYAKVEPGINLVTEIVGGSSDWNTALKTKFASGNGPDVFIVDGPALARTFSEYTSDLSDQPWVPNVLESAKRPMVLDGKLMGMPFNLEGYGFIYNKEIFRKAGVTKKPETLSELKEAAEKIKAYGVTPFGNGYSEWWVIGMHLMNIPFAAQPDPVAFKEALDKAAVTFQDNDLFQDFKELFDLTIEYGNDNSLTTDHNAQVAMFSTGKVAMIQQGNWKEGEILEANPDADMGLLPIFVNDDVTVSDNIPVGVPFYWVVNKTSDMSEEGKKFLNWMVTSEVGRYYITDVFGYIPAFDSISSDKLGGLSLDIIDYASKGKTIPWSFTTWHDGMYNEFAEHTQKYVAGKISYSEMLKSMQASWIKLAK